MNKIDNTYNLIKMSAYEGSAAATGIAALCSILAEKGIISSGEVDKIIRAMEFVLQNDGDNLELVQAGINVRQKFSWF